MFDRTAQIILRDIIAIAESDYGDTIQEQVIVYCRHLLGESIYDANDTEQDKRYRDEMLRGVLDRVNKKTGHNPA